MQQTSFSFNNLWPDISAPLDTADGFSALVVLLLIATSVLFFLWALAKSVSSMKQVKYYRRLIEGVDSQSLVEKQRDLLHKSKENEGFGKVWREFDESLVVSSDGRRLHNTLDAEHFFNAHTLARGLTENRLLAAVPGFLTAIGVVGTFIGLQLGLSSLNLGDADVNQLKIGIGHMISGASVAFLTSVWGVGTSVVFNFFEKLLERLVRSRIYELQKNIDYLFPRITAEQSLVAIAEQSKVSSETLEGLAEQIGGKMQEAVIEVTSSIRTGLEESLTNILAPAIQSLVDSSKDNSNKVMEGLVSNFQESFGEMGIEQKRMMDNAANGVSDAVNDLSSKFCDLSDKMKEQVDSVFENDEKRNRELASTISNISEGSSKTMMQMTESLDARMSAQQERELENQNKLQMGMQALQESQSRLVSHFKGVSDASNQSMLEMKNGLSELLVSINGATTESRRISETLVVSSKNMEAAAGSLEETSSHLNDVGGKLSDSVASASDNNNMASEQFKLTANKLSETIAELSGLKVNFSEITDKLMQSAKLADSGFQSLKGEMESFTSSLAIQVGELEEQVVRLLKEYGSQVEGQTKERLHSWNEQTNQYISTMSSAVQSIAGLVDELDSRAS